LVLGEEATAILDPFYGQGKKRRRDRGRGTAGALVLPLGARWDHQPLADKIANLAPGELRHARAGQSQRLDEQSEFGVLFTGRADEEPDRRLGQNDVARRRSFGQGGNADFPRARAQPLIATCREVKRRLQDRNQPVDTGRRVGPVPPCRIDPAAWERGAPISKDREARR
jgi:hypothetical protein